MKDIIYCDLKNSTYMGQKDLNNIYKNISTFQSFQNSHWLINTLFPFLFFWKLPFENPFLSKYAIQTSSYHDNNIIKNFCINNILFLWVNSVSRGRHAFWPATISLAFLTLFYLSPFLSRSATDKLLLLSVLKKSQLSHHVFLLMLALTLLKCALDCNCSHL